VQLYRKIDTAVYKYVEMKKKLFFLCLILWLLFSCRDKRPKYYYLSLNNYITSVKIKGGIIDSLENGDWSFYDSKDKLLSKGVFEKGMRNGEWLYSIDNIKPKLTWQIYSNDSLFFKINYLSDWKIVPDNENIFHASFQKTDSLKGKYLLVDKITNDTNKIKPAELSDLYLDMIKEHFEIKTINRFILTNNNRKVFLNIIEHIRYQKSFMIYQASFDINDNTYDIIYSTDDLSDLSGIIYFNIIESCFVRNIRVINPLYPYVFSKH